MSYQVSGDPADLYQRGYGHHSWGQAPVLFYSTQNHSTRGWPVLRTNCPFGQRCKEDVSHSSGRDSSPCQILHRRCQSVLSCCDLEHLVCLQQIYFQHKLGNPACRFLVSTLSRVVATKGKIFTSILRVRCCLSTFHSPPIHHRRFEQRPQVLQASTVAQVTTPHCCQQNIEQDCNTTQKQIWHGGVVALIKKLTRWHEDRTLPRC